MMTSYPAPQYRPDALTAMPARDLLDLMVLDEDRVPRNVIDECASRGEAMIEALRDVLAQGRAWDEANDDDNENGEWWLNHHAVMILGMMPDQSAGLLLLDYMRGIDAVQDEDLQEWLSGRWPALFLNKPADLQPAMRALAEDFDVAWHLRHEAVESVLAMAQRDGGAALDTALDWAAVLTTNPQDDEDLRMFIGYTLLAFAPVRHRALLEKLARGQSDPMAVMSPKEVATAYLAGGSEKQWEKFADPWDFYAPKVIAQRQKEWAERAARKAVLPLPVRTGPKIGRNDPCPCGSGKKYKKCCLDAPLK